MSKTLLELLCEKKSYDEIVSILKPLYEPYFPIEVRFKLAPWLENKLSILPRPDDSAYCLDVAQNFQRQLIAEIKNFAEQIKENDSAESAILKSRLLESSQVLQLKNVHDLLNHLLEAMRFEFSLYTTEVISQKSIENSSFEVQVTNHLMLANDIDLLFKELKDNFENYQCEMHGFYSDNEIVKGQEMSQRIANIAWNLQIDAARNQLMEKRQKLFDLYKQFCEMSICVTNEIVSIHIENWKCHQKMFNFGYAYFDLAKIQKWCQQIASSIHKMKEKIQEVECFQKSLDSSFHQYSFSDILKDLNVIFLKLIESSFVIEDQPPQVIKIGNKIRTKLRLLVGNSFIDSSCIPEIEVMIFSEEVVREIAKIGTFHAEPCGELLNSKAFMAEYTTKEYRANIENLVLKKIERKTKRDVTDEKFALVFKTSFKVDNETIFAKLISLPIVIIVHVNQEVNALATIIWDAFGNSERKLFEVPEQVTWKECAVMLNMMFKSDIDCDLSKESLHFIANKLFNSQIPYPVSEIFENDLVSWHDFCKKKINNHQFTFWEWFYLCFKLTKDHLYSFWNEGFIEGFISKADAENKLKNCADGTFLLRFSDSAKASISIAYVLRAMNGKATVMHVQPFSSDDLKKKPLADRLNSFDELKILFPDIQKKAIPQSLQKEVNKLRSRYVVPCKIYKLPSYSEN